MKLQMMLWEERRWQVDGIYYSGDWGGGREKRSTTQRGGGMREESG